VRILLVGDYPPDPTLGSTKVLVKLREEFHRLGHPCDLLLADALGPRPRNGHLRQAVGPLVALSAVRAQIRRAGRYDVVDVASAEGRWIGALRTLVRQAAVISRSNGLEHLNYRRMLADAAAGLARKGWTRRMFHPAVRLTQVAAAARAADRLLLLNPGDRAFALARGWKPASQIDVVPHGVSDAFLTETAGVEAPRGRGILFCGSWTAVKGIHSLVDAFVRLHRAGCAADLTVLGGGVPEAVVRQAFPPDLQTRLTVRPRAPEPEVMAAYRTHDVLAWPSTYEGYGMVLVEAMSQRLPVVATPVGCAPSLVVHEQSGLLVPPRDPGALASALVRMLQDPALRTRCAVGARDRVRGMTWTATARRTLEVYARALAERTLHA
jgi:glycosyltransferase involved in cell wall biosynthesis